MSVFAIADLHLSFSVDKPMNIFGGWSDYTDRLEKNWRSLVKATDTVVVPGDISWAMDFAGAKADFAFLDALPGRKIIGKGNHDYWWNTVTKMDAFCAENGFSTIRFLHNNAYAADGIAVCGTRGWFYDLTDSADKKVLRREAGRLDASIRAGEKLGPEPVVFLHYPPVYGDYRCEEMLEVLAAHNVKRCFYGHLHGASHARAVQGEFEGVTYRMIAADYLRFVPYCIG